MSSTSTGQNIQKHFQKCPDTLIFNTERLAFSWKKASSQALTLPRIAGVYALFSHGGERIQKVGKAEGKNGLAGRLRMYTRAKTDQKLAKDSTVQLWLDVMTSQLLGQELEVYYVEAAPIPVQNIITDQFVKAPILAHWARDFELQLSLAASREVEAEGLGSTHMLLTGTH
jgi:hypothetical protein